jgi:hypothetical protein
MQESTDFFFVQQVFLQAAAHVVENAFASRAMVCPQSSTRGGYAIG